MDLFSQACADKKSIYIKFLELRKRHVSFIFTIVHSIEVQILISNSNNFLCTW